MQLGGELKVFFRTSQGARYVDQLVNGVAPASQWRRERVESWVSNLGAKPGDADFKGCRANSISGIVSRDRFRAPRGISSQAR